MDIFFAILFWLITPYSHATVSCDTYNGGHVTSDVSAPAGELATELNITRGRLGCK